jgi:hypothetical protein
VLRNDCSELPFQRDKHGIPARCLLFFNIDELCNLAHCFIDLRMGEVAFEYLVRELCQREWPFTYGIQDKLRVTAKSELH